MTITEIPTSQYLKIIDIYLNKIYPNIMNNNIIIRYQRGVYYICYDKISILGVKKVFGKVTVKTCLSIANPISVLIGESDSILINGLISQWFINRNPDWNTPDKLYDNCIFIHNGRTTTENNQKDNL